MDRWIHLPPKRIEFVVCPSTVLRSNDDNFGRGGRHNRKQNTHRGVQIHRYAHFLVQGKVLFFFFFKLCTFSFPLVPYRSIELGIAMVQSYIYTCRTYTILYSSSFSSSLFESNRLRNFDLKKKIEDDQG